MARYFFHLHDGVSIMDNEGTELPHLDAAREQAVLLSGELLRESGRQFWDGEEWKLDVTDSTGLLLFSLMFVAVSAPSTESARYTRQT